MRNRFSWLTSISDDGEGYEGNEGSRESIAQICILKKLFPQFELKCQIHYISEIYDAVFLMTTLTQSANYCVCVIAAMKMSLIWNIQYRLLFLYQFS
jgi:hypothetical protein